VAPVSLTNEGLADIDVIFMLGAVDIVTFVVASLVTVPLAALPVKATIFELLAKFWASAAVIVYVAVHVAVCPTGSVIDPLVTLVVPILQLAIADGVPVPVKAVRLRVTFERLLPPSFLAFIVYVTMSPALRLLVVLADWVSVSFGGLTTVNVNVLVGAAIKVTSVNEDAAMEYVPAEVATIGNLTVQYP